MSKYHFAKTHLLKKVLIFIFAAKVSVGTLLAMDGYELAGSSNAGYDETQDDPEITVLFTKKLSINEDHLKQSADDVSENGSPTLQLRQRSNGSIGADPEWLKIVQKEFSSGSGESNPGDESDGLAIVSPKSLVKNNSYDFLQEGSPRLEKASSFEESSSPFKGRSTKSIRRDRAASLDATSFLDRAQAGILIEELQALQKSTGEDLRNAALYKIATILLGENYNHLFVGADSEKHKVTISQKYPHGSEAIGWREIDDEDTIIDAITRTLNIYSNVICKGRGKAVEADVCVLQAQIAAVRNFYCEEFKLRAVIIIIDKMLPTLDKYAPEDSKLTDFRGAIVRERSLFNAQVKDHSEEIDINILIENGISALQAMQSLLPAASLSGKDKGKAKKGGQCIVS